MIMTNGNAQPLVGAVWRAACWTHETEVKMRSVDGGQYRMWAFAPFCTLVLLVVPVAGRWVQPPRDSYEYLSAPSRDLFDASPLGGGAATYNALEESRRTTYESVTSALEAEDLLRMISEVSQVWGEIPRSTQGRDQFRLSVRLTEGAANALMSDSRFEFTGSSHVKRQDGTHAARGDTTGVRQKGGPPSLQISWLREDPTVGEVDVDYIPFGWLDFLGFGHTSPQNSDVRSDRLTLPPNYEVHRARYGDLVTWWRNAQ